MAVTQNSNTTGIPITVTFTEQGTGQCLPPQILDAFRAANWRANFPTTLATNVDGTVVLRASTLPDNITRIDNEGAIYTPGITKIEVEEQTVNIGTAVAPGVPVEMSFAVPSTTDLNNTINNINFDIQPPESPVYIGPPRLTAGRIYYSIYRIENGTTPPYPAIVVRGFGRLFIVPSPSPL